MELGFNAIPGYPFNRRSNSANTQARQAAVDNSAQKARAIRERQLSRKAITNDDVEKYLKDIIKMSSLFNRKLKYSVNSELRQVTVKVIDRETDKVIKELPPETLQRLHKNMREALGLLIDQQI